MKSSFIKSCREVNGVYTYDKRHSRTHISAQYPNFQLEDGFSEEDGLWVPDTRETKEAAATRARSVLDRIFDEQPEVTCE